MIPDELSDVLDRFAFAPPETIEHFKRAGEWRVRKGERILRWAAAEARSADHITRDAGMLATLEHHRIPAPKLLVLDAAGSRYVLSVQHLLLPEARWGDAGVGLTERGWHSLGAYLAALHERGPRSALGSASGGPVGLDSLSSLEEAGVLTASDRRWLRRWCDLLPPATPLVLTHGYVAPSWIVMDERGDLVLGLTDWSIAALRPPGHDFLYLPEPALWTVLEGYGPSGLHLFLWAKLGQLVEQAQAQLRGEAESRSESTVAEEFHGVLERALLLPV